MEQQARASIYSPPCSLSWIMDVVGSKDAFPNDKDAPEAQQHHAGEVEIRDACPTGHADAALSTRDLSL